MKTSFKTKSPKPLSARSGPGHRLSVHWSKARPFPVPIPKDEPERLADLRSFGVLDTPREQCFDDLTRLASHICRVPIALISLIDESRQWFKSKVGVKVAETPRDYAFCAHAIMDHHLFMVRDASRDKRFAANPLVTSNPKIRFYAGVPLVTPDHHALGTLCVIDRVPRMLDREQAEALRLLSRQVMAQLVMHRENLELKAGLQDRSCRVRALEKEIRELKKTGRNKAK